MKAILIASLLLASVVFLPTSILARTLNGVTRVTGDPTKPAIKCDPYNRNSKCPPRRPAPGPKAPCGAYTRNCP